MAWLKKQCTWLIPMALVGLSGCFMAINRAYITGNGGQIGGITWGSDTTTNTPN